MIWEMSQASVVCINKSEKICETAYKGGTENGQK